MQRQKGVALWRQISDRIRANILAGLYDRTGMVPAETALAQEFEVNRHTVRAALAALQQEGIVRAAQGRGTMIIQRDKFDFPISRRTRFTQGIGEQARDLKGILLSSSREVATPDLIERLQLSQGDEVLRLDGVRTADGRAVSRSTMWFPAERFAGIDKTFAETGSITRALSACGVDDYLRDVTEISAVHAEPDDVAHLELTPGAIVLVTHAVNTDPEGRPIQFAVTRFPADRVQFTIRN
ncbi:phosphonate metabolism transcriptional regulator PhnF [Rhizobium sp. 'Codium 1']|uniref:phosphonate metabolism transcriptional regulator PhnF n=1 Tax=Rhizobium sp. 'Codium 1' TaxID=2940484 RepID=UPI001E4164B8|nr:phosphonate metabolism transcriptional regulator PhnF [Rhizobium sp. 'Codium 1']MCC8933082.1 phosphonate metabolism transcriptional regulator PhnF [Rhizobium sp. 'Codium 1']